MGGDGGTSSHQSPSHAPVTCPPSSSSFSSPPPPPPPDAEIASDPPKDLGFVEPIPDSISSSSSSKPVLSDDLRNKIVHQVEYYFSDENLPKDKFLLKYVKKDKGFVPIAVIASFRKMKKLVQDNSLIETALWTSSQLVVSSDGKKVKRLHPLLDSNIEDAKSRTVLVENLPEDYSTESIQRIFGDVGIVKNICIRDPHAVQESTKTSKAELAISSKLHALVEYETVEAAEKAVATLNDEKNWRSGLHVESLLKRMGKYGLATRGRKGTVSEKSNSAPVSDAARDAQDPVFSDNHDETHEEEQPKFTVMASRMGGSTSVSSPAIEEDAHNPLWRYVTKQQKLGDGGGNMSWQCNFCHQTKRSSYPRVRAHLIHEPGHAVAFCPKVKSSDIVEMKRLEDECNERLRKNAPKKVPLPTSSVDYDSKKRKASGSGSWSASDSNTNIGKSFNLKLRDQMDAEIARMFNASGLPFHLARSPYYVSCIQFAANNALASYAPPGYNKLRTSLLQQERAHVDRLLQPIKGTWKEKGVSIVSDGWSDSQRRPLINFMAVTESGPMFLKAVDCTGEIKDKYFIYGLLKEVIEEVGPQNVIQVITDNAKNCAGAGHLIEAQFENIVWTPCVVHTLNLALQNICMAKNIENNALTYEECRWITDLAEDVVFVKNFIMNHSMRLAIFNEFVPLKLLSVASTRFASVLVMLKRFKLIKGSLQAMVISERWNSYREDDKERAKSVKDFVLDDIWWDKMTYILSFMAPIYDMLRVCDMDRPCLHLVYDMWDTMIEKVKGAIYRHEGKTLDETSTFYEVVHKILVDRWNKNNTPLHCLAHSLNPRYYSEHWLHEDPSRVAPHRDMEVARERMKILKKYFPNLEERKRIITEFADFSSKSGEFADIDSIRDCYEMDPKSWWVTYGACAPLLQTLAFKLLVQPSSSSCAERNWSTYSFVHSVRRNKMTPKRAEDLVFIHSNLRLHSRRTPQYMKGETKMWDIAGDAFDSFEDAGELEIAQLSLDESELEAVLFSEDGDGGDGGGPGGHAIEV